VDTTDTGTKQAEKREEATEKTREIEADVVTKNPISADSSRIGGAKSNVRKLTPERGLRRTRSDTHKAMLAGVSLEKKEEEEERDLDGKDPLQRLLERVRQLDEKGLLGSDSWKSKQLKKAQLVQKELRKHDHHLRLLINASESLYRQASTLALRPSPPHIERVGPFDKCRELLSHLYFGIQAHLQDNTVAIVSDDEKLRRSIKLLDKNLPARECHKIGVIYVAEGQDDQRQILRNYMIKDDARYQAFLEGLGWEVEMQKHPGFVGGLDKRGTTGDVSLYFSDPTVELMFHVVSLMPTKENDTQQIHKKRHVGNDHVHIVYCKDKKQYRPKTITSQFNDAHIVVYPLKSRNSYRIQIHKKDFMPPFGPLQDGMVVGRRLLGPLVRLTAYNASRARRSLQPHYMGPLATRQARIKDIIERYTNAETKSNRAAFLAELYGKRMPRLKRNSGFHFGGVRRLPET